MQGHNTSKSREHGHTINTVPLEQVMGVEFGGVYTSHFRDNYYCIISVSRKLVSLSEPFLAIQLCAQV